MLRLDEFGLGLSCDWIGPGNRCYRPPSWPPPKEWVVFEDKNGNALSRWGYSEWNLSLWAGKSLKLNFGDGPCSKVITRIDPDNAYLLRIIATWLIWGPRAASSFRTIKGSFQLIRRIVAICSAEGILASELKRYPRVLERVQKTFPSSQYMPLISMLHRLWDARDEIGFCLIDAEGIRRMASAAPEHESIQSAYIPPRIWIYQIQRLRACLDEFNENIQAIKDCYAFCLAAYARNYGSLEDAFKGQKKGLAPFDVPVKKESKKNPDAIFHGGFEKVAERFGIRQLIERWMHVSPDGFGIRSLTSYLSLVQFAGLAYVVNFTLQRISEADSLRTDCLIWENDQKLGRIPIIRGETTKTQLDSDARWPTSPNVESAIIAMSAIAKMRMSCAVLNPFFISSEQEKINPFLIGRASEPWLGNNKRFSSLRPHSRNYDVFVKKYDKLFDLEQLRITEEDIKIALMMTPNLRLEKGFCVGMPWIFTWHQLRRTGAVNMFASGLLSEPSMQFLMKHCSIFMTAYYVRGFTKLRMNENTEAVVVSAMYEVMGHNLKAAMGERFVSPHGEERKSAIIVSLVGEKDVKQLAEAARHGRTFFREIRLGACTKRGNCSYGGVESVARCAGGDGGAPCADVLYDRTKTKNVQKDLERINVEITRFPEESPRYRALIKEKQSLENYLNGVE